MDDLAEEARRLRREEGLSGRQIQQRLGVAKQRLQDWLRGVPPPAWTRRPNAKDELHARAVVLRQEGWSVNDVALELGIARSTAWQWVRHLPLDADSERARSKREHAKLMLDGRWARHREARDARRAAIVAEAAATVRDVRATDLMVIGALLYWAEGSKGKPWREFQNLTFTNSDPRLIRLYLAFLGAAGVSPCAVKFRLAIHESADVPGALAWWSDVVGVPAERFQRTTLKRHVPKTTRHNTGEDYRGCLVVNVCRGRELYWWIEGLVDALAEGVGTGLSPGRNHLCDDR